MTLHLFNTLTQKREEFAPLSNDKVTLYTCGPTVYDYPHVGNWAAYIYWDILVRTLLANDFRVERVMNITDVGHLVSDADDGEDKLEKGARREGKTAWQIAEFYAEDFVKGMEKLGLIPPEHTVKATDFIDQQLELVSILKEKGYTYQTSDGIYYDTSKFSSYADFAHLDLAAQKAGARVESNEEKRNPSDFALWKFTPAGQKRDMEWETPHEFFDLPGDQIIMGFPGWHLECSAMAMSILGATIDIHTGGIDHIPVHHTNEIAQSQAASGKTFANYWLHNNHLKIDGGKVSKSLGNGYTLQNLEKKGFSGLDLRLFILQGHYSNEGNFTFDNLTAAKNRRKNWQSYAALVHQTHDRLDDDDKKNKSDAHVSLIAGEAALKEALSDNLNTPEAFRIIDESFSKLDGVSLDHIHHRGLVSFVQAIDNLLGLQLLSTTPDVSDDAKRAIIAREQARKVKDWATSDTLRDELLKNDIVINDTPHGPVWSYK
jgi:cysteinyl-tRNA synthetase